MTERGSALWRQPVFFRFWAGRSAAFLGAEMSLFVLPVTAATVLHANVSQMGLLAAAQTAPHLLFGLVAGAWADRWPRERLLAATDLARGLGFASAPLVAAAGLLSIEGLYALAFVLGTLTVIANVSYQAMVPAIAGRGRLVSANAYFEAGGALAETAGPVLGGMLLQAISWTAASLAGAVSFVLGSLGALGLTGSAPVRAPLPRRALHTEIIDGIRFVLRHPGLRSVVLCGCVDNVLGVGLFGPLYVLYATRSLGVQPAALGLVFAMTGAGGFLGALIVNRLTDRFGARRTLVGAQLLTGLARVALATVAPGGAVLATLLCAEFLMGVSMPLFNVNLMSLRQAAAADHLQGRVNATVAVLLWGATPVGGLLGGAIGAVVGVRTVLGAAAAMTCVVTAVLFVPSRDALEVHVEAPIRRGAVAT